MWMPGSKEVGSEQGISKNDQDRYFYSHNMVDLGRKSLLNHDLKPLMVTHPFVSPPSGGEGYSPAVGCGRGVLFVE